MKILKYTLITLFSLVFLIAAGITLFILTFDLNKYKSLMESKLTFLLKRPVVIESVYAKPALIPTITIVGFKIMNTSPFVKEKPLLFIQKMDAVLELAPILKSQINIREVDIDEAQINLYNDGKNNNWTILPDLPQSAETPPPAKAKAKSKLNLQESLHLNAANINKLTLSYNENNFKKNFTFNRLNMKDFHLLNGEVSYEKQTFTFNLNSGSVFDFLNQSPKFPIDLKIQSRLGNLNFTASIGDLKTLNKLQAKLSLKTTNLKNLCNFFGIKHDMLPPQSSNFQLQATGNLDKLTLTQANFDIGGDKDFHISSSGSLTDIKANPTLQLDATTQLFQNKTSEFWQISPMTIKTSFTATKTSLDIKEFDVDANRSDVQMNGKLDWKEKLNISLNVTSDFLGIYDFVLKKKEVVSADAKTAQEQKKSSATKTTIPWDVLNKTDAKITANVTYLDIGEILTNYVKVNTTATLKNGQLDMPFNLGALDGTLSGDLQANSSKKAITFSVRGKQLNLDGVRALNPQIHNVTLETAITTQTKGNNVQELLKNLSGHVIAETYQGQIVNKWFNDLPKLLNLHKKQQSVSLNTTDSKLAISCAAANFNIKNGVITGTEQLALETNAFSATMGGSIDLNKQTMDVTMQPSLPTAQKADDLLSLAKAIRITGPFDNLSPSVDTQAAATNLLQLGANKLLKQEGTTLAAGQRCQNVLGKDALTTKNKTTKAETTTSAQSTTQSQQQTQAPTKKQFQEQLLNSLFQALDTQ